jgi:hypothetical protein
MAALAGCGDEHDAATLAPALGCQVGLWRMDDGLPLAIQPGRDTPLTFRLGDGRFGRLEPTDDGRAWRAREGARRDGPFVTTLAFEPCQSRESVLTTTDPEGAARRHRASRVDLRTEAVEFESHGTRLAGRLLLPAGPGPWPLAVLVHGSEKHSALDHFVWQYFLPADGVAAFVYDKRGTGHSDGEYTQDFDLLSDDAVAALATARALRPDAFAQVGFLGGSQGAWIGPLAASKTPVDFVVALYGFAESPLAEDREEVADELRRLGYSDDVLARAREATDATGEVMASRFRAGFDRLAQVERKYAREPWFVQIQGEFTGDLLRYPHWLLRIAGPWYDVGTSWRYDPATVVPALAAEQLWVLADADTEAPNRETRKRLAQWQAEGRPLDVVVFPGTEHGMYEFDARDGERVPLRYARAYFPLLSHWIRTRNLDLDLADAQAYPRRQVRR